MVHPRAGRWALSAVASAGIAAAMVVVVAVPAAAHHANVIATGSCDGTIAYGVTSWSGQPDNPATPVDETALSRTNEAIEVTWSADGRKPQLVDDGVEHRLAADNDFSFSGTFTVPRPLPEVVTVSVVPLQPWASGARIGEPRTATVDLSECKRRGAARGGDRSVRDDTESTSFGETSDSATTGGATLSPGLLPWVLGGALIAGSAALLVVLWQDRRSRYARPGWW